MSCCLMDDGEITLFYEGMKWDGCEKVVDIAFEKDLGKDFSSEGFFITISHNVGENLERLLSRG